MHQPTAISPDGRHSYYPYFDYLRAVAAFGVFVGHSELGARLPANFGNACVQLFFALSGFLIGGILLRSDKQDIPRFYFNRAVRIWIPYAIAVVLLAVVTAVKQGFSDPKFREFFFYMCTFVYNWFGSPQLAEFKDRMPLQGTGNHFWSICVEEQFYLIAPFFLIFLGRAALFCVLAALVVLSPYYFASVTLGVILAVFGPKNWILGGTLVLGLISVLFGPYILAVSLLSVTVVGALARPGTEFAFGRTVGGASYPFYLNHWVGLFAINALVKIGVPYWMSWTFGAFVAVAFSVLHYLAIDRMVARYRNDWYSHRLGILLCIVGFVLCITGFVGASLYNVFPAP
jgi:peptidoglycan/LPS O-acetylase OafA/YrhL